MSWRFDGTRWLSTEPPPTRKAKSATVPEHLDYEEHRDWLNEQRGDKWDKYVQPEHGGFGGVWGR